MSPIKDASGKIAYFSGNQLDITKRKHTEDELVKEKELLTERVRQSTLELNETKEYLESIVETIRQPLVVLDEKIHVISANKFFYKTFKVKPKDTEGKKLYQLGNKQWNIPRLKELLEKVLPTQNPFEGFEVEHNFPTIGKRIMVLNARQVELKGSGQQRVLLAIEDITERKGAEKATKHSQALTKAMINSLNAHIAVLDKHGVIIDVNEAWINFARGQSNSSVNETYEGQNYLSVLKHAKGDMAEEAPLAYEGIKNVMEGKIPHFSLEYPCFTPHEELWFLLQVTPLRHDDQGVVVAHINITERKQTELRKDDFISMASHELKTPITSMKMNVQALQRHFEKRSDETAANSMAKVNIQIKKLTRLVNELLDVSRIYAGKLEVRKTAFDINNLVKNIIEDFNNVRTGHTYPYRDKGIINVSGDPDRIEQVIINLFTNAMKYSPQKSTIKVGLKISDKSAILSVKDEGIGIDKDKQKHVFDRFYQVTDPTAKTYPGLGMGLYISNQIIEHHGGKMWVKSEKGKGSTFYFSLPLA